MSMSRSALKRVFPLLIVMLVTAVAHGQSPAVPAGVASCTPGELRTHATLHSLGIEKHGRRVRKEEIFEKWDIPDTLARVEPQVLTLKAGCNAIDAGDALPNVAEDFVGKAPDLGAHEFGAPLPHYGPREKTGR